jgi:hypothetical protein
MIDWITRLAVDLLISGGFYHLLIDYVLENRGQGLNPLRQSSNPVLLDRLHLENDRQERSFQRLWHHLAYSIYCLWNWQSREAWNEYGEL